MAHFLYQHPKIVLGLLDCFIPADVKETWMQLISLLEGNNRKVLGVEKGSLVFKVYCPTMEGGEHLKQLTYSNKVAESFIGFANAAGKIQSQTKETQQFTIIILVYSPCTHNM